MSSYRKHTRSLLLGATALVGSLALAATPAGAEERHYDFDVPAQPLESAVQAFARQAQQQVIFADTQMRGMKAPPLNGSYSADEGLAILLAGTGLEVRRTASGVLKIAADADPQSGSAAGGGAEVEALIVTAQKREEDIQDVPIAISAFTQESLERSQVAGGPDLMTQIPNFTFTKTNFTTYSIQIRGIGTQAISATTDAAVAIAMNNTSFIRNRFFEQEFYDLQRVEVLRGPQGTLYGRNATAGVVNILTAKPKFTFEAKGSADVSNYNSTRLEGMVNIPLAEDAVALRLAGAWTKRDGFVTNEITGNPIDGRDLWSTRVSLRVSPSDTFDANLIWEHFKESDDRLRSGKQLCHQDDRAEIQGYPVFDFNPATSPMYGQLFSQGCLPASLYSEDSFEVPNGNALPYFLPLRGLTLPIRGIKPYTGVGQSHDLRVIESTVDPEYWAKSDIVELQLAIGISDGLTLTSETGYGYDELFSKQDFNRFNTAPGAINNPSAVSGLRPGWLQEGPNGGIFCDPQIGCADRLVGVDVSSARSRQFSQEFRISSDYDGPLNFSLGGNFLRYDTEDKYYVFINTLSMYAANPREGRGVNWPPYVAGVTDNHECMFRDPLARPDPEVPQAVQFCIAIDPNPIGSLNDEGHNYFLSKNPYKLISYAAFGEIYYDVNDAVKLTAGLRYTVDKKEAPRIPSWVLAAETLGYPIQAVEELEWREPTGRLALDWKPKLSFTDETLLYASYAHGYKAGGSNPPVSGKTYWSIPGPAQSIIDESATKPQTFEPEFVDAFEIGAKNTLLDGRLTLNANAFYYDYKDYQISQIIDRSAVNSNYDAEVWGLEIEADWRPLENLKLGLKGGYEKTRVADGERAIDIMDRTAGKEGWVVVRPFPVFTENCVLPTYVFTQFGTLAPPPLQWGGGGAAGSQGPCEFAYALGWDPYTKLPYVADPTLMSMTNAGGPDEAVGPIDYADYIGFNPLDPTPGHNNGEGFFKELGGNELPNAPHFTGTLTVDYTVPLPREWLMTLHGDLYYQSEAWTRIFNTEGYDKLKAYTNVNLAAILTNEEAGWTVMAYVKNLMDRDSITGAFLYPDDVGLTTNVFLTEPRLYGVRVTKSWAGGSWWGDGAADHSGPARFTIELGGLLARYEETSDPVVPQSFAAVASPISPAQIQDRDLDLGAAGEVKLSYAVPGGPWRVSAAVRAGKGKGADKFDASVVGDTGCLYAAPCPPGPDSLARSPQNWIKAAVVDHEQHVLVDFNIGRDVGVGAGLESSVSAGLRYAQITSRTLLDMSGVPDWDVPEENIGGLKYEDSRHHFYDTRLMAEREFKGFGPTLSWDGSKTLIGREEAGSVGVDWSLSAGVLFGKQKTSLEGKETASFYEGKYNTIAPPVIGPITTKIATSRSKSVTVPTVGASLGLSYEVQRVRISGGYRWERYFDVLDVGDDERKEADRTIDGPYLKLSVGFGGR